MVEISNLTTEKRNDKTLTLDQMSGSEIAAIMNAEDVNVIEGIKPITNEIGKAIEVIADRFNQDGRLIYIGAGTSGRLGVLDAAECVPTFGVPAEMVVGIIAGGEEAFLKAVEGAEDSEELAIADLKEIKLASNDVVVGIAASGRTPYVIAGLEYANSIGAATVAVSCNVGSPIGKVAHIKLEVEVGPEVLTGSTRLKSGTAQKMILNMLSTGSMIRIGKVYKNLMVDVQLTNIKLEERAKNIVMEATGVERAVAEAKLSEANNVPKVAIVMILAQCDATQAQKRLADTKGFVSKAIQ